MSSDIAICGENSVLPARITGCGEAINSWPEVYRCTDCDIPFHKECARKHFGNHVLTQDDIDQMTDAEAAHALAAMKGSTQ